MSARPVRLYDQFNRAIGGSNTRHRAAVQSGKRRQIPALDKDHHRTVSGYGRRTMMTIGRWLVENFPEIRGLVNEIASHTTAVWNPQFATDDDDWNEATEQALAANARVYNYRGGTDASLNLMDRNQVRHSLVDGDVFELLVDAPEIPGYPQGQTIPAHRIYSRTDGILNSDEDGKYKGRTIIDGVILDDFGRALAFRFWDSTGSNFQDIPAYNVLHRFEKFWEDQVRGYSPLACALFNMQDCQEWQQMELMAQKVGSSIAILASNASGEADITASNIESPSSESTSPTHPSDFHYQTFGEGLVHYLRAGEEEVSSFINDRPTQNQRDFVEHVTRASYHGLGWSYDWSLNSTKIGGAPLRAQADKVNRTIREYQRTLIEPFSRRRDLWRLIKLQKLGTITEHPQFTRWDYQRAGKVTADVRYDSDVRVQSVAAGHMSEQQAAYELGNDLDVVMRQRIRREKKWRELLKAEELPEDIPFNTSTKVREYEPTKHDKADRTIDDNDDERNEEDEDN